MDERSPSEIRTELGISMEKVAAFAHVDRTTLRVYEAHPSSVKDVSRERCDAVYRELDRSLRALERLRKLHDKGG